MKLAIKIVLRFLVLAILFMPAVGAAQEELKGHVGFFFVKPVKTDATFEVHDDFQYYYKNMTSWLIQNGFAFSYHTTTPIVIASPVLEEPLTFGKDPLEMHVGMIMIKPDGTHKISYGVGTGVDLMLEIQGFFEMK